MTEEEMVELIMDALAHFGEDLKLRVSEDDVREWLKNRFPPFPTIPLKSDILKGAGIEVIDVPLSDPDPRDFLGIPNYPIEIHDGATEEEIQRFAEEINEINEPRTE